MSYIHLLVGWRSSGGLEHLLEADDSCKSGEGIFLRVTLRSGGCQSCLRCSESLDKGLVSLCPEEALVF